MNANAVITKNILDMYMNGTDKDTAIRETMIKLLISGSTVSNVEETAKTLVGFIYQDSTEVHPEPTENIEPVQTIEIIPDSTDAPEESDDSLKSVIKNARMAMNLSIVELSKLAGCSTKSISGIENGTITNPSYSVKNALEKVLKVDITSSEEKFINHPRASTYFKILRERMMMEPVEIAQKAGISPSTIHDFEKRGTIPKVETFQKIINAMNISVDDLVEIVKNGSKANVSGMITGETIKRFRLSQGMNVPTFSKMIGEDSSVIRRFELNNETVCLNLIERICKAFKVSKDVVRNPPFTIVKELPSDIGQKIQTFRMGLDLGRRDFAEKVGVSYVSVYLAETQNKSTPKMIHKIAASFKVNPSEILS